MTTPRSPSRSCKLCGNSAGVAFTVGLDSGQQVDYYECGSCRLLQSFHLDDLSPSELGPVYNPENWRADPDPGATWRLSYISRRLELLSRTKLLPRRSDMRALDFGSGSGFVVSYLRHRFGTDAWGYEPYATAFFAPECTLTEWQQVVEHGPYQWVIASEVFEHFIDPEKEIQQLKEVLGNDSALFITTGRYIPGKHGPDWSYLAVHAGQHVALYADRTMDEVAGILGFSHVYRVGGPNEWLLTTPSSTKARLRSALGAWILRALTRGGIPAKPEPA